MSRTRVIATVALASVLATFAHAETLQMGDSEFAARFEQAGKPVRGMSRDNVLSTYGDPSSRQSAVGSPPISRWDYAGFVVFFEYDHVVHSVTKR